MAMADSPISRRNFLYGMVGAGAAVTSVEESWGQADLKRELRCSELVSVWGLSRS